MESNWNELNVEALIQRDNSEINKAYKVLKNFAMWFYSGNEELYHDAFLKVLDSLDKYDKTKPFHIWVYNILDNQKKTNFDKQKSKRLINAIPISFIDEFEFAFVRSAYQDFYDEQIEAETKQSVEEKRKKLFNMLFGLKDSDRSFVLNYYGDKVAKSDKDRKKFERLVKKLKKAATRL